MKSKIPILLTTHTLHHRPHYTPTPILKRKRNTRRWGIAMLPDESMQLLIPLIQDSNTRSSAHSTEHGSELMLSLMEMLDIEIAERSGEATFEKPDFEQEIHYISRMIWGSARLCNTAALSAHKHMLKAEKEAARVDVEAMALDAIELMDTSEAMGGSSSTIDLLETGKLGIS